MGKLLKARTEKQLANDQRLRDRALASKGTGERTTRAQGMREVEKVHSTEETPWVQGGSLAAPKPRPGYVQRWIRGSIKGKDDAVNISRKFREGWKPRPADTVPSTYQQAKMEHGKFSGYIMVEGMILCELPISKNKQRTKFMADLTQKRVQAIDADLKRANDANRSPAFGEIQKSSRTIQVREVRVQQEEEAEAE